MKKLLIVLLVFLAGCSEKEPYIIGFSATLSGTNAIIGVQEMYGAELAVQHINESGGVNGRMLTLEIRDDLADNEMAVAVDNELIDLGVVAIIGHGFSSVAEATVSNANERDVLLISPSIGTDALTDIDDLFVRLVPSASYEAEEVTNLIVDSGLEKVMLFYDEGNFSLTEFHMNNFVRVMNERGLTPIVYRYHQNDIDEYFEAMEVLKTEEVEAVFIVGDSLDAANFIQLNRNEGVDVEYHLSAWASSGDFSQRVNVSDDIYFYNFYNSNDLDVRGSEINKEFQDRYGLDISMVASYAYDAVMMLAAAMEGSFDLSANGLLERIIEISTFDGIQSQYVINQYGDVERDIYQYQIIDGEIISKEE